MTSTFIVFDKNSIAEAPYCVFMFSLHLLEDYAYETWCHVHC